MILIKIIIVLFILPLAAARIYVYNTVDSPSIEQYDCILHDSLYYCRRPTEPIVLNRSNDTMQCYHDGIAYSFANLSRNNVSIGTVLHGWKSSIEKVEQYIRYMRNPGGPDEYVCNCIKPRSFGKNCEYLLPVGTTFARTLAVENSLKQDNPRYVQEYGNIICYTTLECNSGLLCLDWRDICDGVQQCMAGLDEKNCDKLEYNECEKDEYRCMNGMCVPDEYFLDGEFDCLDWSDEIQYYDDTNCPIEVPSAQCDDRICPPNQWSCGDGQCISNRFDFQIKSQKDTECQSQRDQFFICETHLIRNMWTQPNGRCYQGDSNEYEEPNVNNRTASEECLYIFRCDISGAIEKNCTCGSEENSFCDKELNATCPPGYIQYPKAGIMAPYVLFFYPIHYSLRPEYILINGTIKCNGILVNISDLKLPFITNLRQLEDNLCQWAKNNTLLNNDDHGQDSFTYGNRSYSLINVCNTSKKRISTYRIKDGFDNCVDGMDETTNISLSTICSKMHRYRFRCSADELTCLSVTALVNRKYDCKNKFDELWLGTNTKLSDINCNKVSKGHCEILREFIENSWLLDNLNEITKKLQIPFRYYCDTFWNLASNEDENVNECQKWWECPDEQWRCNTGQCIDESWVLDGEWDCRDASDEDDISNQLITDRNLEIVPLSILTNRSIERSKSIPFSTICNLTTEFPCIPINFSNLSIYRPCISRHRFADGHIDCYGGIDERNTIAHCNQQAMLGYNYKCMSTNECIPYGNHCNGGGYRCSTKTDDEFWCEVREAHSSCYGFKVAVCFNGTCMENRGCDGSLDCPFGEDEYMCDSQDYSSTLTDIPYRKDKEIAIKNTMQKLRLIRFPTDSIVTELTTDSTSAKSTTSTERTSLNDTERIVYWCNRGVGIKMQNGSIACFCPPQYYGDKCEFHTDRIIILLHLNISESIYTNYNDTEIILKILILFLFNNKTIANHVSHIRPSIEMFVLTKKTVHFLYSRSLRFLQHKKERYFNRLNITNDHPYSIRIEVYELKISSQPVLNAVWQYPIYFDYLPVFRFTKALRLIKPDAMRNSCSSNPCNSNQECRQLINDQSKYICLCKGNFKGENCSIEDQNCIDGFCANGSICKPDYRSLLIGDELPYCICPFDYYGEQCSIKHDRCSSMPCLNNGSCYATSKPDTFSCVCTEQYYGNTCGLKKPEVKLYINESIQHAAAVVQYFDINFKSLNLILVHQQVYRTFPDLLEYQHAGQTVPNIILVKLYSSDIEIPAELYLISVHLDVTTINATTQVIEKTRCKDIHTIEMTSYSSPIQYHSICQNQTHLFCFRDEFYLCICEENYSRVECFNYDDKLDQCSRCLAGGQCIQGDRSRPNDFICLCPPCYSGTKCQFNSNSFAFTLDQLFFPDLNSVKQKKITFCLLIIIPLLLALIALPNNLFSFITFRREKSLHNGVGHYLLFVSIINQINLSILVARLIHLSISITGSRSHPIMDNILCKVLNYLLICFTRIAFWLVSFVATERVYTVVFLKGQWLKKPYVAQRLIALMFFIVFASGAYEPVFVRSFPFNDDGVASMCVIEFPMTSRLNWMLIHRIVSIIHSMLPLLINLCCTITMIYIITKTKLNIRRPDEGAEGIDMTPSGNTDTVEDNSNKNLKTKETRHRLYIIRDVISDNKEMISRPTITLIPSIFSLFSLPLFIISFSLGCRNIENHPIRYALIVFNFVSFIPQIITFFLYVYPSSLYFNEWRLTRIGQWILVLSTRKDERTKTVSESKHTS